MENTYLCRANLAGYRYIFYVSKPITFDQISNCHNISELADECKKLNVDVQTLAASRHGRNETDSFEISKVEKVLNERQLEEIKKKIAQEERNYTAKNDLIEDIEAKLNSYYDEMNTENALLVQYNEEMLTKYNEIMNDKNEIVNHKDIKVFSKKVGDKNFVVNSSLIAPEGIFINLEQLQNIKTIEDLNKFINNNSLDIKNNGGTIYSNEDSLEHDQVEIYQRVKLEENLKSHQLKDAKIEYETKKAKIYKQREERLSFSRSNNVEPLTMDELVDLRYVIEELKKETFNIHNALMKSLAIDEHIDFHERIMENMFNIESLYDDIRKKIKIDDFVINQYNDMLNRLKLERNLKTKETENKLRISDNGVVEYVDINNNLEISNKKEKFNPDDVSFSVNGIKEEDELETEYNRSGKVR